MPRSCHVENEKIKQIKKVSQEPGPTNIGNFFQKTTKAVTEDSSEKTEPSISKEDDVSQCSQKATNEEILGELWVKEELQFNDQDREASKSKGR